ncbi:hypothetical protein GCM10009527_078130 [Actinomadura nitritigenes]|nr:lipid II flippase MurJ [Actinomadura nitritigenes]
MLDVAVVGEQFNHLPGSQMLGDPIQKPAGRGGAEGVGGAAHGGEQGDLGQSPGLGGTGHLETLTTGQMLLLSIGTSGGVAAQMAVLAVTSRRTGFRLRLHADPRGIGVRSIAAFAGWTIASAAAAQVVFIVSTRLASQAGQGS